MQRLAPGERPTEDMQLALLSKICPKQFQAYVELHLSRITSYAQVKEEILRVIEAGLLGGSTTSHKVAEKDKPTPMEVDPFYYGEGVSTMT